LPVRAGNGNMGKVNFSAIILTAALLPALAAVAETVSDRRPDLAEHLVSQLSRRTNGHSAWFTGPVSARNQFQSLPVLVPDFWLRDVTNILAMSQGQVDGVRISSFANYLMPVSPHICIAAAHMGRGEGSVNLWLLPDGTYYRNTVVNSLVLTNAADIVLLFMARTNWTFVKIFPEAGRKLNYWLKAVPSNTVPVFVRFHRGSGRTNSFHSTFVSGSQGPGWFAHVPGQFEFGDYSQGDRWVSGDSSSAAYGIVKNEALLFCVASFPSSGTALGQVTNQINAAMAALCASNGIPPERLTLGDLSGFQDY
jgi:hypothetical protein